MLQFSTKTFFETTNGKTYGWFFISHKRKALYRYGGNITYIKPIVKFLQRIGF